MLVMFARLFIARPAITEFKPVDNAGLFKKLDGPVDGGDRNRAVLVDGAAIELINIRVVLGITDDSDNDLTLTCHANAAAEAFFQKVKGHGCSVVTGRGDAGREIAISLFCPLTVQTATL